MKINNQFIKNTKIIATSGPTFETYEHMLEMIKRGVNVVRLNMSHGSFEEHQKRIENARKASKKLDVPVSIMLDTKGPEIRIHKFEGNKANIELNQKLTIHTHEEILGNEKEFSVTYYELNKIVKKGDLILCDDGKLSLIVEKVDAKTGLIDVLAQNKHTLSNNKAVNVPGIKLTLPFVSEYDLKAIEWGLTQDIDFIAASFVSSAEDVLEIQAILKKHNKEHVQVISKIESVQSIQNINEIVTASDGIMLARGDLGVEIPYEKIPFFEKLIINKVRATGKSMIIATQMLDSMQQNPRPTRAEVTDVYYAALSGTDSTMLSGESASGLFPYQTVETMAKIDREAEMNFEYQAAYEQAYTYVNSKNAETSYEVAKLALNESISFVFALSSQGRLVKALSSFRLKANIIALVEDEKLLTYFGTWYGVYPQKVNSIDEILNNENLFKKIANEIGIKDQKVILSNKKEFKVVKV